VAEYLQAALEFIDPALGVDSPPEEVLRALARRRELVGALPAAERAEAEELLEDAVRYIERIRGTLQAPGQPEPAAAPVPSVDAPLAQPADTQPEEGGQPAQQPVPSPSTAEAPTQVGAVAELRTPRGRLGRILSGEERSSSAGAAPSAVGGKVLEAGQRALPEAEAWPFVRGLMLILWQVWIALFGGWAVVRLIVWPRPAYGYSLKWYAALGLAALALGIAAGFASILWRYRNRTGRLSLLVHCSAAVVLLDMLAWWLAARRFGPQMDHPAWWLWVVLAVCWLMATLFAALHDARQPYH
jgi:hypothetical protein